MTVPPPSAYVPLFRRFASEKARDLRETKELYARVKAHQDTLTETKVSIGCLVYRDFGSGPESVTDVLISALYDLLSDEEQIWELPAPDLDRMSLQDFVEYRNLLYAKEHFFANKDTLFALLYEGLSLTLGTVARELPELSDPTPFTIPLVYALPDPRLTVEQMYGTLWSEEFQNAGLFRPVCQQFYRNICAASGRDPDDHDSRKPYKHASESTMPLDELVETYLGGTPFRDVFLAPVPLKLTREDRYNHMHVVGGTGAGKTTLIESLILHDLRSDDPPSLVLIDPHSDLVRRLISADLGIEDRLIFIDPRDTQHPPALNIFALNRGRMGEYDEATREQVTAGVIQTFNYLFSGLTNLTLTGKQEVFFRYVARLMLSLPETMGRNATILDMLQLMSDPAPYGAAIQALPDIPREFFTRDFMTKTFEPTKEQIRYRLQAIIENPTMARLFTSQETKVDLFSELNRGAVILVDTAKDFLKENSSTFGRLFISLVLQSVLERAAIPEEERKSTFLIVDEAASFFSSNIDDLLTEARKYRCGCLFAHQYLDQTSSSLRASLAANTAIKFASGLSAQDASAMARDMRTTPEFILNQPKLQFAAHIRSTTPQAVSIPISPVRYPKQLSSEAFAALIERNRARVSLSAGPATVEGPPGTALDENEDISPAW